MSSAQPVVVTDIQMPFMSMVSFLIKLALASIPAAFVMAMIWALVAAVLTVLSMPMR